MDTHTVALVPARGGSKSIPFKNVKLIGGKPLIHWVIEAALGCKGIDEVYLASDSQEIRDASRIFTSCSNFHAIDRRPENATDTASTESAVLEFAEMHDFASLVLIQATSPLLTAADLDRGLEKFASRTVDSVLSVVRQKRFIWNVDPTTGNVSPANYDYRNRPRRQEYKGFLVENGAFYITSRTGLLESKCRLSGRIGVVEMPPETYLELDEPEDWIAVDLYLRKRLRNDTMRKLLPIKLLAMDFDGVLTDNCVSVHENGTEAVSCSRSDGMGIALLRERTDLRLAVISAEENPVVARRCEKVRVPFYQGCTDKAALLRTLSSECGLESQAVAYMGNDINDLGCLRWSGFSAAPCDAHPDVLSCVDFVTKSRGGHGAVRELADMIVEGFGRSS